MLFNYSSCDSYGCLNIKTDKNWISETYCQETIELWNSIPQPNGLTIQISKKCYSCQGIFPPSHDQRFPVWQRGMLHHHKWTVLAWQRSMCDLYPGGLGVIKSCFWYEAVNERMWFTEDSCHYELLIWSIATWRHPLKYLTEFCI